MRKLLDLLLIVPLLGALGYLAYTMQRDGSLFGPPTATRTPTATQTAILTATPSPTRTRRPTRTPTLTPSPTSTPLPTDTESPTGTQGSLTATISVSTTIPAPQGSGTPAEPSPTAGALTAGTPVAQFQPLLAPLP